MPINIEIKASCARPAWVEDKLLDLGARFEGTDHQIDTYFKVEKGRLKLREGNIENNLIYYQRSDREGPKQSDFFLQPVEQDSPLKEMLTQGLGVEVVVDKSRKIFFIDNVKFHIDEVKGLGGFVEIEASDLDSPRSPEELRQQCFHYLHELGIREEELQALSYSDLILEKSHNHV
ncbi:MAG: class IV adenylate cyclase [Saprospiraceae bacterium]|nr:class IV adenylate cyclase [Saprospiraceae bacterium]